MGFVFSFTDSTISMRPYFRTANLAGRREKMGSWTQDELSSIWDQLTDGTECDEHGWLDMSGAGNAYKSHDTDVEQTLTRSAVATYGDFNSGGVPVSNSHTPEQRGIVGGRK